MRVEIRYHQQVRAYLREWLAELAAREPGGELMAEVATDLIGERFTECNGHPPEARNDRQRGRALRWWQFCEGFLLGYVVRDRGFGPWRTRRVIFVETRVCPPDPDPRATARG